MKIIDLLNKISNGEEINHIRYKNLDYFKENDGYYTIGNIKLVLKILDNLNDEIKIIEEDKKIEKLKDILHIDDLIPPVDENMYKIWTQTIKNHNKINELINKLGELDGKIK